MCNSYDAAENVIQVKILGTGQQCGLAPSWPLVKFLHQLHSDGVHMSEPKYEHSFMMDVMHTVHTFLHSEHHFGNLKNYYQLRYGGEAETGNRHALNIHSVRGAQV